MTMQEKLERLAQLFTTHGVCFRLTAWDGPVPAKGTASKGFQGGAYARDSVGWKGDSFEWRPTLEEALEDAFNEAERLASVIDAKRAEEKALRDAAKKCDHEGKDARPPYHCGYCCPDDTGSCTVWHFPNPGSM